MAYFSLSKQICQSSPCTQQFYPCWRAVWNFTPKIPYRWCNSKEIQNTLIAIGQFDQSDQLLGPGRLTNTFHLTLKMTYAQVVETSISPFQDYTLTRTITLDKLLPRWTNFFLLNVIQFCLLIQKFIFFSFEQNKVWLTLGARGIFFPFSFTRTVSGEAATTLSPFCRSSCEEEKPLAPRVGLACLNQPI